MTKYFVVDDTSLVLTIKEIDKETCNGLLIYLCGILACNEYGQPKDGVRHVIPSIDKVVPATYNDFGKFRADATGYLYEEWDNEVSNVYQQCKNIMNDRLSIEGCAKIILHHFRGEIRSITQKMTNSLYQRING